MATASHPVSRESSSTFDRRHARTPRERVRFLDGCEARGREAAREAEICGLPPLDLSTDEEACARWRGGLVAGHCAVRAGVRAVLLFLALAPLAAMTVDGYALGLSYHTDRTAGYREQNPGAGLGLSLDLGAGWEATGLALAYRDSVGNRGSAAGIGARYTVGPRDGIHATAAAVAGYLDGSGYAGPVCMPIIGTGYGPVTVEATYNPDRETAAAWLRIAWRVGK